jgi:iron uptake system EfeUOB component EfeO/EfeM
VKGQADQLVTKATVFAAVKSGNVDQTKALFAATRAPYEAIEPIAESFGDLDPAIDAREGDGPDEEWGGFHRIEKAAWDEADLSEMAPVADKLVADVKELRSKIDTVELEPSQIANGAVDLLNEISTSKIPKEATEATAGAPVAGEEDRYSGTDLSDVAANLAGAKAAFAALEPLIKASDAELATDLEAKIAVSEKELAKFSGTDPAGNGYVFFTTLTPQKAKELADAVVL